MDLSTFRIISNIFGTGAMERRRNFWKPSVLYRSCENGIKISGKGQSDITKTDFIDDLEKLPIYKSRNKIYII